MNFNQISFKMFKANLGRYWICFLCSSFSVMVYFIYETLCTNKSFMNSPKIDSSLTTDLLAPRYAVMIFSVFFILYTYSSFEKYRKKEFGLFMILGMTNLDIGKIIIFENSLLAVLSISAGLISGSVFARLFYFVVLKIIDVRGIDFTISSQSYIHTIIFFVEIYAAVILWSGFISSRYEITNLLKGSRIKDKNLTDNPVFGFIGMLLMMVSCFYEIKYYNGKDDTVFLRSLAITFIGIYMMLSNLPWYIKKLAGFSTKMRRDNIIFISDLKFTIGQSKKVLFIVTILASIVIFLGSVALIMMSDARRVAVAYNPYHIAYVEYSGKNKLPEAELNRIIKGENTPLVSINELEYIWNRDGTFISDKNFNAISGENINVKPGHFLSLFEVQLNDGYLYDTKGMNKVNIRYKNDNNIFVSQGKRIEIVFNNVPLLPFGNYIILNKQDYQRIRIRFNLDIGTIKFLNFKDWEKTEPIVKSLQEAFDKYNKANTRVIFRNEDDDRRRFRVESRIGDYLSKIHEASYILFIFSFIGLLFFIASIIFLHFKLLSEYDREKRKYIKLYRIGITDSEVKRMVSMEFRILFFLPYVLATVIAAFYSYTIVQLRLSPNLEAAKYSVEIGGIYLILQVIYYFVYRKIYISKLTAC